MPGLAVICFAAFWVGVFVALFATYMVHDVRYNRVHRGFYNRDRTPSITPWWRDANPLGTMTTTPDEKDK